MGTRNIHEIHINKDSFSYKGEKFLTLSAISRLITEKKYAHGISAYIFFKRELAKATAKKTGTRKAEPAKGEAPAQA